MEITMLGKAHAMVTECYNTCFVIRDGDRRFLVDGGGGNILLRQLRLAGIRPGDIEDVFVTHWHIDHILGIFWLLREFSHRPPSGSSPHKIRIYGHDEVIKVLRTGSEMLFPGKDADTLREQVRFIQVCDGELREVLGRRITFFDIRSQKAKQFGFTLSLDGDEKLTCCGDECYHDCERDYVENSAWLLQDAFCLQAEAEIYHPARIQHSTVRDACELAERMGVKNLLLYHTEDQHLAERKKLYNAEGRQYYHGNLFIPDDLETISLT